MPCFFSLCPKVVRFALTYKGAGRGPAHGRECAMLCCVAYKGMCVRARGCFLAVCFIAKLVGVRRSWRFIITAMGEMMGGSSLMAVHKPRARRRTDRAALPSGPRGSGGRGRGGAGPPRRTEPGPARQGPGGAPPPRPRGAAPNSAPEPNKTTLFCSVGRG